MICVQYEAYSEFVGLLLINYFPLKKACLMSQLKEKGEDLVW